MKNIITIAILGLIAFGMWTGAIPSALDSMLYTERELQIKEARKDAYRFHRRMSYAEKREPLP